MLRKPLTPIDSDTEEASWMVMGMPQGGAVTHLYVCLEAELHARGSNLLIAPMLPIRYRPIPGEREEQLAPDILVAPVEYRLRSSYVLDEEGVPPSFVLEVISPESRTRDMGIKRERYELIGIQEYALFAPQTPEGRWLLQPPLQGYRLDPLSREYMAWKADERGRLWSEVLGLWLVVREGQLRLQRPDGSWLSTLEEEKAARAEEARARAEAVRAREEEAQARLAAEAEIARLRAMLEKDTGS